MEKPILFSTEMVKAILEDRKTMTRRIIKPQPDFRHCRIDFENGVLKESSRVNGCWDVRRKTNPPYQVGDRLWVRETWRDRWGMAYANYGTGNAYPIDDVREIEYKAGGNGFFMHGCNLCPDEPTVKWGEWSKWRPSIHMPREAARIFLRVTNVRVERLREITAEDAKAEGCIDFHDKIGDGKFNDVEEFDLTARDAFVELWDSLNAKPKAVLRTVDGKTEIVSYVSYPWDDVQETREYRGKPWAVCGNPWVWAIELRREG